MKGLAVYIIYIYMDTLKFVCNSCKNVHKYNWKPPLHNVGIIMFAVCMSAF